MNGKLRRDAIIDIMRKQGYTTVQYLTEELHFSSATINRDLNILEKQQILKRSYGGAELIKHGAIPVTFRYNKAKPEKRQLAMRAAAFVEDGDTIFIDASTTTQYMVQFLADRKNLTVITNNMAVATYLSEYNFKVICLGGKVVEIPCMLAGDDAAENAAKYIAKKCFFTTGGISPDFRIWGSVYDSVHKNMIKNSGKVFYLVDSNKMNNNLGEKYLCTIDEVDCVITNYVFPQEIKNKYSNTEFVYVET